MSLLKNMLVLSVEVLNKDGIVQGTDKHGISWRSIISHENKDGPMASCFHEDNKKETVLQA